MGFFKRLFGRTEKPKETLSIDLDLFGKVRKYEIDISDEAIERSKVESEKEIKNAWKGSNKVESVRNDGYVIYKTNRVTSAERKQIGFYGLKWFSDNGDFCVVYLPYNDEQYNLGLVDVKSKTIIYQTKLQRPKRCKVTCEGIVVCEDWGDPNKASSFIYVIDVKGNVLIEKRHNTAIGDTFEFTDNETQFKYNMNMSGKVHVLKLK